MLYKLSLVNILENVFVFIEILFKMLLFKGGVLIYAEHCIYIYIYIYIIIYAFLSKVLRIAFKTIRLNREQRKICNKFCAFQSFHLRKKSW